MKFKITLLFIFSFTMLFAQSSDRLDYRLEAEKGDLNYYQILKKKKEEIKTYDLSVRSNTKTIKHFKRWAFFWKDRVDANGNFPNANQGFYNANILDENGKINKEDFVFQKSQFNTEPWVNVGPKVLPDVNGNTRVVAQMGRLTSFLRFKHATDRNQDVIFVGAPNGGIWKSTDGGTNWTPKLDFVAGIGVTDIKSTPDATIDNYMTKPIFVSTGDYDGRDANSIGVLKSMDGGETYESTGLTYNINEQQLLGELYVIDEDNLFVGGKFAILKTTDGGATWTENYVPTYNSSIGRGFGRVAYNGKEIMYTGYFETTYTEDYTKKGNPWVQVVEPDAYSKKAVTVGEDGNFYIQDDSGQVQKFDKVSKTFSDFGSPTPGYNPQQGFNQTLIVESDFVLSGSVNGGSSTDAGATWFRSLNAYPTDLNPEGSNIHPDIHRFGKLDGSNEYWCLSDGGLDYIDYDNETDKKEPTVNYKSEQVYVTQSYSVSINPSTNDGAYVIDNQDTGSFSKVKGTWYSVSLGDGIQSAINYNDSNIRYASNQNGALVKTDSGFKGQLQGNGGFINIPGVYFYFPLEMNKVNPDILYAGGDEVYQIDALPSLAATSLASGAGTIGEDSSVFDIATHGTSIFASGVNGLRFSADSGATWSTVNFNSGKVNSLDFSAASDDVLYVTIPGYNPNGKVFKSIDGGTSFTNITGNLPNVVIKEVLFKQNQNTETLFVATEIGVYFTKNGGTNWDRLGKDLPNVDVRDIEIHYLNDKLVAATYGRGLWEIDIAAATLSTDNFSDTLNALSVYPNPADDILNINVKSTEDLSYLIYNVIGGVVQRGKLDTNNQIDISTLAKNVYILRVYNNNESFSSKFIKRSK